MTTIRKLHVDDIAHYRAHLQRHFAESGQGEPAFAPFPGGANIDFDGWQRLAETQLALPIWVPGWRRAWCVWEDSNVVGHVELTGAELAVSLHRATLGVGLERGLRGQGRGGAAMADAIHWAKTQAELSWVDLTVFSHSHRAIALYRRLGFEELCTRTDRHRIDGQRIDEIMMTLALE